MRVLLALALCLVAGQVEAANLCVKTGGSDATAKASIVYTAGNEAGSTCWATIGRAAWGSTTRSSPNASEAAAAGDTIYVFGGSYDYAGSVGNRFTPVYNPVNSGTAGNPITFTCIGDCTTTSPESDSPIIGASGVDYITWYADISLGYSWVIPACAEAPNNDPTDDCGAGTVSTTPDTGPVICHDTDYCRIEGFTITGSADALYVPVDNWPAIRFEVCSAGCVAKNNTISGMRMQSNPLNNHGACFQLYNVQNAVIEHNNCSNGGSGIMLKDKTGTINQDNVFRFNKITTIGTCMGISHVSTGADARSFFYQNTCADYQIGVQVIGSTADAFVNNTFYDGANGCMYLTGTSNAVGVILFHNNICLGAGAMVFMQSSTMPADTILDLEHNVYQTYTNFYTGTDGSRTFASYKATYTDQDQASPASVDSNPLLVDATEGDYRPCTGSGTPDAGCSGASPAINLGVDVLDLDGDLSTSDNVNAGAYITGSETIGIETAAPAASSGRLPRLLRRLRL